jgi:hypothetical protein
VGGLGTPGSAAPGAGGAVWPPGSNLADWTQPADRPDCEGGHRMEHLLTITGDIQLGDCGGVCFVRYRKCPGLPWDWRFDCS